MQEWRAPFGAAVGRELDRHERQPVPAPLRRPARDARPHRPQRTRRNAALNPNAIYRDPMTMDDYLSARPDHVPVRALRLRRAVRRVHRGDRLRRRRSPTTCPIPRCASKRWARRSSSGCRGTRARSPTSPRSSARPRTSGPGPALQPSDVDLALVYDGFTFNAISWIEALGILRVRRGLRLARRRTPHRPRRRTPGQPARRAALRGPDARLRVHLRRGPAIAPRRRRPPGR